MLEDSLFESQGRKKTRKPLTVVISAAAHIATIVVLAMIPLVQTHAITLSPIDLSLWAPKAEPAKIIEVVSSQPGVQKRIPTDPTVLTAPETIPDQILFIDEPVPPALNLPASSGIGTVRSFLLDLISRESDTGAPPAAPPPAPPPPPAPVESKPVRIGGNVQAGNLIRQINPVYPPLARQARIQGIVVLEAIISNEGTIRNLRVVSGHPLLTQAALDAVQLWRYRPTLLNGDPVEVITTITVNFTFQ